jgi:hypothetical protein
MEHTSTFLGIAPEAVLAEFVDPDFLLAFSTEVGVTSGELDLGSAEGVESAAMPWRFPTDRPGIPSLARKFLPEEVQLDWSQQWGPVSSPPIPGTIRVALYGSPSADVDAKADLMSKGEDTVYRVRSKTKTSLRWPLAGTVESSIDKELVGWILQVQARVLRRRLRIPESG